MSTWVQGISHDSRHRYRPGQKDYHPRYRPRPDKVPTKFLAIDGEGWGVDDEGRQLYQLMVAANDEEEYILDTGKPLRTHEILEWLVSLPAKRILIGFSFGYDTTMILKDLPHGRRTLLHRREDRMDDKGVPKLVGWSGWGLDVMPRKELTVIKWATKERRVVHDVFAFFGFRYLKVLDTWDVATPEEYDLIERGKTRRSGQIHDRAEEARYSVLECKTLCRVMDKIRNLSREVGYPINSYHGAGSMAGAVLKKEKVREHIAPPPAQMMGPLARAYFGGRFETAKLGPCGEAHYYDLNSAYAAELLRMPCLACGHWRKVRQYDPSAEEALWRVEWATWQDYWAPLPYRDQHQRISFPQNGYGWYWARELANAVAYLTKPERDTVEIFDGWVFERGCNHQPFGFIPEIFERRLAYKAEGNPAQLVLKTILASLYGKTAQTIGKNPPYASMAWAGMTTSGVRAKVFSAIMQAPESVVAVATDSVSSLVPLDLPISKALGDWEYEHVEDLFVAGDGLTHSPSSKARTRTRGARPSELVWPEIRAEWDRNGINGEYRFEVTRFLGLAVSTVRNRDDIYGKWVTEERKLRFRGSGKRTDMFRSGAPTSAYTPILIFGVDEQHKPTKAQLKTLKHYDMLRLADEGRRAATELDNIGPLETIPAVRNIGVRAEWDWSRNLGKAERSRLKRRWTAAGGTPADVFSELFRPDLDHEETMTEWLRLTRVADAGRVAPTGKELGNGYGGHTLGSLFVLEWNDARLWETPEGLRPPLSAIYEKLADPGMAEFDAVNCDDEDLDDGAIW